MEKQLFLESTPKIQAHLAEILMVDPAMKESGRNSGPPSTRLEWLPCVDSYQAITRQESYSDSG